MKYLFSLLLLASSAAIAPTQAVAQEQTTTQKGLFTVTQKGESYFFEIPDSLVGRLFLATVRYTNTPANALKYGGEQANQQSVYWEKAPGNQLLLRANMFFADTDSTDNISRSVYVSSSDPIIGAFNIEGTSERGYKIKVNSFFKDDDAALGLNRSAKTALGVSSLQRDLSYIESIKSYPTNVEVRLVNTYYASSGSISAQRTGNATIGLNISFVLLPKEPMRRRLFDPRVGYFANRCVPFTDDQQTVGTQTFITRYRLEPKDSLAADSMRRGFLVEPKKPIVYYIDPATPKQWIPYLIKGVNDWQVAFEKAGFKNAIIGKEWPNDSTMSLEDARFSVIRYLASNIENAYGPNVHDPRSGEIIESHVCWYHNVMTLLHDWYMIQAGTLDEAARKMKFDTELMGELIRFVSSHEVGHSMGLRHNFGASSLSPVDSLRNKEWVEKHGHTASIMDYARFNYVAQPEDSISRKGLFPRVNDYDIWAIQWGYTPMLDAYDAESDHWELEKLVQANLPHNPRLWFGDGETNKTNDPRCQTEDLGDDAMKASHYGILNLKRIIKQLPEWTYESNDIYHTNLMRGLGNVISQYRRYMGHVARNIGGVEYNYRTVDEPGAVYTPTSREKQLRALDFIDEHVFTCPTWLIEEPFVARLYPRPADLTDRYCESVLNNYIFDIGGWIVGDAFNEELPFEDYLEEVDKRLFRGLDKGTTLDAHRRLMQTTAVVQLNDAYRRFSEYATDSPQRPYFMDYYERLHRRLLNARATDKATRLHYANLADLITKAKEQLSN